MGVDTKMCNSNFFFTSGSAEIIKEEGDQKLFSLTQDNDVKCQGIGCAFAPSCGRFVRAEMPEQKWASYYALPDDDCQYFEPLKIRGQIHGIA